jgi:putative tryptophan/tyrosine transport system substrate-binding protein
MLSWFGTLRGTPTKPRFRTIQVCPKDLQAALRQAEGRKTEGTGQSAALIGIGEEVPMLDPKRREFIALVGGGGLLLAAKVKRARGQQPSMPVVGLLGATTPHGYAAQLEAFRQGLSEAGFVEGRNVAIEYRWADDQYDRLPALAADLARRQVAVIATLGGNTASVAAKAATTTIPVVFHGSVDPVEAGLVASLNRPGGNVTGVVTLNMDTGQKRLELMHELLPAATTIGLLLNPTNAVAEIQSKDLQAAARTLGLQLQIANASTERDFDAAFATLSQGQVGGLVIGTDGFLVSQSEQLAALTVRYALPTIFQYRAFVTAGGLMSYGGSVTDSYRLSGVYTGRILKGEKPADLPVQQATKVELIINLKTARTLGITFPITLLGRADEVIE